jgi:alpha-amylase
MSVLGSNEVLIVKRPLVSILSNRGASASSVSYTLKAGTTGWKPNMAVRDAVSSKQYTTDGNGDLVVSVVNGEPLVLLDASLRP